MKLNTKLYLFWIKLNTKRTKFKSNNIKLPLIATNNSTIADQSSSAIQYENV